MKKTLFGCVFISLLLCVISFNAFSQTNAYKTNERLDVVNETALEEEGPHKLLRHSGYLRIGAHFYIDNTEFFNPYRVGRTYIGNDFEVVFSLVSEAKISLDLGVFINHFYGDETPPTQILPVARLTLKPRDFFSFTFGNINTTNRHGLNSIVLREDRDYSTRVNYGLKSVLSNEYVYYATWANMYLLVTEEHREFFAYGNNFKASIFGASLFIRTYISHHGGQLFHTGVVKDNMIGAVGLGYRFYKRSMGFYLRAFLYGGVDIPNRNDENLTTKGRGVLAESGFILFNVLTVYANFWKGLNFITEEGNPMFQTEMPYFYFGARFMMPIITDKTKMLLEAKGHVFEKKFEYQFRVEFFQSFDIKLYKFPKAE